MRFLVASLCRNDNCTQKRIDCKSKVALLDNRDLNLTAVRQVAPRLASK